MDDNIWLVYQFHKEDLCQGMVLAFRRPECSTQNVNLKLWGVSLDVNYEIYFEDSGVDRYYRVKKWWKDLISL